MKKILNPTLISSIDVLFYELQANANIMILNNSNGCNFGDVYTKSGKEVYYENFDNNLMIYTHSKAIISFIIKCPEKNYIITPSSPMGVIQIAFHNNDIEQAIHYY